MDGRLTPVGGNIQFRYPWLPPIILLDAGADGGTLDEMKKTIPDQLAPQYERGMSKYPLGQYRDRVGVNIETVYQKVVKKG